MVHIGSPFNETVHVLNGISLEDNEVDEALFQYHLMVDGAPLSTENEYTRSRILEDDVELVPCYLISINGAVTDRVYVRVDGGHTIGNSIDELIRYTESDDYIVGDMDNNAVINVASTITGDINIIVMDKHTVVIDYTKGTIRADEVNVNDLVQSLSELSGIDKSNIIVKVAVDKDGFLTRVSVFMGSDDLCITLVSSVNTLIENGKETCEFGIICRASSARIIVDNEFFVISESYRFYDVNGITIVLVSLLLMTIQ